MGFSPFTEQVWQNADRLKLIVHMAGSVKFLFPDDTVRRFCLPRNVTVVSCAQALAVNVAEMTIALMVMVARRIYEQIQAFRERGFGRTKFALQLPDNQRQHRWDNRGKSRRARSHPIAEGLP